MSNKKVNVKIYNNCIPSFVGIETSRLYKSIYSSLDYLDISGLIHAGVSTYVAESEGSPITILLFFIKKRSVIVLNEVIKIEEEEISRFVSFIFKNFSFIHTVHLNRVFTRIQNSDFPLQKYFCIEDYIIFLPETVERYDNALGSSTRKNIKRYIKKITRDHPSINVKIYLREEVAEKDVMRVINLSRLRINKKGQNWTLSAWQIDQLIRIIRKNGMVVVIEINGEICAGEICSIVETSYFSHIGAHDPIYDSYSLGILSCYLLICECIKRGGKEFHMLWGNYDYKVRLGGLRYELQRVVVYRSKFHLLLHGVTALENFIHSHYFNIRKFCSTPLKAGTQPIYKRIICKTLMYAHDIYKRVRSSAALWWSIFAGATFAFYLC